VQLELAGRSGKGRLKAAARAGALWAAVLDDDSGAIELRDMQTGEQEPVAGAAAAVAKVIRGRHPA
jgi:histidyl-tRNA synthetase